MAKRSRKNEKVEEVSTISTFEKIESAGDKIEGGTEKEEVCVELTESEKLLVEWRAFWEERVKGKHVGTVQDGKDIFSFYNRYTGRNVRYGGCGSCTISKISFLNNEWERIINNRA